MDLSLGMALQICIYTLSGSAAGLSVVEWCLIKRTEWKTMGAAA